MAKEFMYRLSKFNRNKVDYEYIDFKSRADENDKYWIVVEVKANEFFNWMDSKMKKCFHVPSFTDPLGEKQLSAVNYLDPDYAIKYNRSRIQIPLEMPIVCFNNDELAFQNGRHRSRALEYIEAETLFLQIPADQKSIFQEILV